MLAIPVSIVEIDKPLCDMINRLLAEYPRFCGIIVAGYREKTLDLCCYWNGIYVEWVSENQTEYPKIFTSRKLARKTEIRLQDSPDLQHVVFHVSAWIAPECPTTLPIEKYLKISSGQFSGSPRK